MYCSWWQHLVQLRAELKESGYTAVGQKKNIVVAPQWREHRDATLMVVLAKDENLSYLLGSPLSSAPPSMGGAKFVITTRIDEGTCIVANLQEGTRA
jgi:hypothetical protein